MTSDFAGSSAFDARSSVVGMDYTTLRDVYEQMRQLHQSQKVAQDAITALETHARAEKTGMNDEQRAMIARLMEEQQAARKKDKIAEEVLSHVRDVAYEHRQFMAEMLNRPSVVNISENTTHNHQHFDDKNVHNQVMQLLSTHAEQFAKYAEQQRLSAEDMKSLLFMHLIEKDRARQQTMDSAAAASSSSGPPPPPPPPPAPTGRRRRQASASGPQQPTPPQPPAPPPDQPVAQSVAQPVAMPTPLVEVVPEPRPRRSTTPRRPPRARAQPAPQRVPWSGGAIDPPSLPTATIDPVTKGSIAPPTGGRPRRGRSTSLAPPVLPEAEVEVAAKRTRAGARSASAAETVAYPEVQGSVRSTSRRRARSTSVAETIAYPDPDESKRKAASPAPTAAKKPRTAKARSASVAPQPRQQTQARKRAASSSGVVLPTEEDAQKIATERARRAAIRRNAAKFSHSVASLEQEAPQEAPAKRRARSASKSKAAEDSSEARAQSQPAPKVRKVAFVVQKRKPGRPKGAVGIKKRLAMEEAARKWVEAESSRLDAIAV